MKLPEPTAWMSRESMDRLASGGNDSRGTVPVHKSRSRISATPLYSEAQVKELLAQADKDFSDGMTVVHLQVADQMKRRYEPVLREALEALDNRADMDDAADAIRKVLTS